MLMKSLVPAHPPSVVSASRAGAFSIQRLVFSRVWVTCIICGLVAAAARPVFAARSAVGFYPAAPRWIGVAVSNIAPVFSRLLGLKPGQGLLVRQVIPGGPAAAAGLRAGDLLVRLNGRPLLTPLQLVRALNAPGAMPLCRLVYLRDGARYNVTVTPAPRPVQLPATVLRPEIVPPYPPVFRAVPFFGAAQLTRPKAALPPVKSSVALRLGPGVVIPLPRPWSAHTVATLPRVCTITQWSDRSGVIHTSISTGNQQYVIDPAHLSSLPPQVRTLARVVLQRTGLPPSAPTQTRSALAADKLTAPPRGRSMALARISSAKSSPATHASAGINRSSGPGPAPSAAAEHLQRKIRRLEAQIAILRARLARLRKEAQPPS